MSSSANINGGRGNMLQRREQVPQPCTCVGRIAVPLTAGVVGSSDAAVWPFAALPILRSAAAILALHAQCQQVRGCVCTRV